MSIELVTPTLTELKPRISVFGVGGAGGNAIDNMIRSELQGVEFVAANTDAQALAASLATNRIQLGVKITQGLGAGAQPSVGQAAAEEAIDQIEEHLNGCHMAFITAGMGGGTGTGAAPVIAKHAKEKGILTVGVVTKPFQFEGGRRMNAAESGIEELQKHVDTLIIIPNQNLFLIANERTTFAEAFAMADEVLHSGVRGITDLMIMPGLINLDFADIRTVMNEMGKAMMGTGESTGDGRAIEAAQAAISNPLLDEVSMKGAKGVIINITGGLDLTLFEVDEAANHIRSQVDPEANIIVGSAFNEELNGLMRVSVVATGIEAVANRGDIDANIIRAAAMQAAGNSRLGLQAPKPVLEVVTACTAAEEEAVAIEQAAPEMPCTMSGDSQDISEKPEMDAMEDETAQEKAAVEEAAEAMDEEDIFIAPEPMMPKSVTPMKEEPDPFAIAALENGRSHAETVTPDEEVALQKTRNHTKKEEARRTPSLFERVAGGFRGHDKEDKTETRPARPAAVTPIRPEDIAPPKHMAGRVNGISFGSIAPGDRPAPVRGKQDDGIDIPSFLKEQVN